MVKRGRRGLWALVWWWGVWAATDGVPFGNPIGGPPMHYHLVGTWLLGTAHVGWTVVNEPRGGFNLAVAGLKLLRGIERRS